MQPLIAGIDPGTTTAYCILDFEGNIVETFSARELDLTKTISKIFSKGTPIIVGCDKKKTPQFVKNFSRKTGAKIVSPKNDLTKVEKKELVTEKMKNDHEFDALSGARFALSQYTDLFSKIDRQLVSYNKEHLSSKVKIFLIRHEEMNIHSAVEYLERRPEPKVIKKKPEPVEDNPSRLLEKIHDKMLILEKENIRLNIQNIELTKVIDNMKNKQEKSKVIKEKDSRIVNLSKEIRKIRTEVMKNKVREKQLTDFISSGSDKIILKKFENLTLEEYNKKKGLKIKKNDIIYVENPNLKNEKVINELKKNVDVIIFGKKPKSKISDFILIPSKDLKLIHERNFALVSPKELERAKSKQDILGDIINQYKKERTKSRPHTVHSR